MFNKLVWKVIVHFDVIGGIVDHYCLFFPFITENWKLRNPNPTTIVANSPLSAYIGDEKGSGIVWIIYVKSNSLGTRRRSKGYQVKQPQRN